VAGVADNLNNTDSFVKYFRYLELKKPGQKFRTGTGDDYLGTFGIIFFIGNTCPYIVTLVIMLLADLFLVRKKRLCAPQVDKDISFLYLLDSSGYKLSDSLTVICEDLFSFRLTYTLNYYLFCSLDSHSAEELDVEILHQFITDLDVAVDLLRFIFMNLLFGIFNYLNNCLTGVNFEVPFSGLF
jgi:uncharacterized membrane protein YciS (DUF1049 family)